MPRRVPPPAERGSQYWLQQIVSERSELLDAPIAVQLGLPADAPVSWRSPRADDGFAEYQDEAFLERLGVTLPHRALGDFWPKRGPVWDGLAVTGRGDLLLVEAKSHAPELVSSAAADAASLARIRASLAETQAFLGVSGQIDWATGGYQYANRLAHLYLLRELNGLPAYLVNVYFINDHEQRGPASQAEWLSALRLMKALLGLRQHRLAPYVLDVFVDVVPLTGGQAGKSE